MKSFTHPLHELRRMAETMTFGEIAARLKVSRLTLGKYCAKHGICSKHRRRRIPHDQLQAIRQLAAEGHAAVEIARRTGLPLSTVTTRLGTKHRGWPAVTTTAEQAFGARRFDDARPPAGEALVNQRFRRDLGLSVVGNAAMQCVEAA